MSPRLEKFCNAYRNFDTGTLQRLDHLYVDSVVFKDPVHEINGRAHLLSYFDSMCKNLNECQFVFHKVVEGDDQAYLSWTMHYAHPKLAGGKKLRLEGVSEIEFQDDRVRLHTDYYDMGRMVYENIPVFGSLIRWLRNRLA